MARHIPPQSLNRVVGLRVGDERHVAPLIAWYRERGGNAWRLRRGAWRELAWHGFCHAGFHVPLGRRAEDSVAVPPAADIQRVAAATAMEGFLAAYVAGWCLPAKNHKRCNANVRPWQNEPGWSALCRPPRQPAGAATGTLFVHCKTADCADGGASSGAVEAERAARTNGSAPAAAGDARRLRPRLEHPDADAELLRESGDQRIAGPAYREASARQGRLRQ